MPLSSPAGFQGAHTHIQRPPPTQGQAPGLSPAVQEPWLGRRWHSFHRAASRARPPGQRLHLGREHLLGEAHTRGTEDRPRPRLALGADIGRWAAPQRREHEGPHRAARHPRPMASACPALDTGQPRPRGGPRPRHLCPAPRTHLPGDLAPPPFSKLTAQRLPVSLTSVSAVTPPTPTSLL